MITYDLWWGDSCLCANTTDPVYVVNEVCDRFSLEFRVATKFFYTDGYEILKRITAKSNGVLLVGVSAKSIYNPPRGYQILWREIGDK